MSLSQARSYYLSISYHLLKFMFWLQVVAGLRALIADPNISVEALMAHIPAPDFPTGARCACLKWMADMLRTQIIVEWYFQATLDRSDCTLAHRALHL